MSNGLSGCSAIRTGFRGCYWIATGYLMGWGLLGDLLMNSRIDSSDIVLTAVSSSNSVGKEAWFCRGRKAASGA